LQYTRLEIVQNNSSIVESNDTEKSRIIDVLLLCEAMARKIKKAKLSEVTKLAAAQLPRKGSENLDVLEMLIRVNKTLVDLDNKIDECRRIYLASEESSSSLFSLLPFSSGSITELIYSAHCSSTTDPDNIVQVGEKENSKISQPNIIQRISKLFFDLAQDLIKIKMESNDIKYAMLEPVVEKHKMLVQKQSEAEQGEDNQLVRNSSSESDLEGKFFGGEEDDEEAEALEI